MRPRPDALIAWNDVVAAHITQALNNSGVKVPDDLRVTGFDNDPHRDAPVPAFIPYFKAGFRAVRGVGRRHAY